ncbi:hypothetical protein AMK32_02195 [Streptomyces sp. CB01883]|nr:hypothetical protein AMK32_02195 [Streptomyces sp. CB01883]
MLFLLRGSYGEACECEGARRHAGGARVPYQQGEGEMRKSGTFAQKGRQSMAATRHRSTARRFVRSACRFMRSIVGTSGRACHRRVISRDAIVRMVGR